MLLTWFSFSFEPRLYYLTATIGASSRLLSPVSLFSFSRPNVKYFCDINYDPFLFMQDNNKIYSA